MSFFGSVYAAGLPHRAVSVYMYLKDRADTDGSCWPGINTIASDLGLSRSTIKRALNDLVQNGLIKKEPRFRENGSKSSNLFIILNT